MTKSKDLTLKTKNNVMFLKPIRFCDKDCCYSTYDIVDVMIFVVIVSLLKTIYFSFLSI